MKDEMVLEMSAPPMKLVPLGHALGYPAYARYYTFLGVAESAPVDGRVPVKVYGQTSGDVMAVLMRKA